MMSIFGGALDNPEDNKKGHNNDGEPHAFLVSKWGMHLHIIYNRI